MKKNLFFIACCSFFLIKFFIYASWNVSLSEKQNNRIIEKAHLSPAWYEQNPELLKKQIKKI